MIFPKFSDDIVSSVNYLQMCPMVDCSPVLPECLRMETSRFPSEHKMTRMVGNGNITFINCCYIFVIPNRILPNYTPDLHLICVMSAIKFLAKNIFRRRLCSCPQYLQKGNSDGGKKRNHRLTKRNPGLIM